MSEGHSRHLVLVYDSRFMAQTDFLEVAARIDARAPDIRTFVLDNRARQRSAARQAAEKPSLVVCPFRLRYFEPLGGKVYEGRPMSKIRQLEHFAAAGISVPQWAVLNQNLQLDPAMWGSTVVVKPEFGYSGKDIRMVRTERVADHLSIPRAKPVGYRPGRLYLQRFIDSGDPINYFRVMTFMSEPLLCRHWAIDRSRVAGIDAPSDAGVNIAVNSYGDRDRFVVEPPEIIEFARRVHGTMPERPVLGIDIVREAASGRLYLLEANPNGRVWHLSSPYATALNTADGRPLAPERYEQFDAFNTMARVLIERTREEAE